MGKRTGPRSAAEADAARAAHYLRGWLAEHGELVDQLINLRLDGEEEPVEALLSGKDVNCLRLSWELWDALVLGDGHDGETLLVPHLGQELYDRLRLALWGRGVAARAVLTVVR